MNLSDIRIVADSSADIKVFEGIDFKSAPLKIITDQKEYVDDVNLNVSGMVSDLLKYKGRSSTSCPSAGDWLDTFSGAKYIFCVTITGNLSGSYNSACLARDTYTEQFPDRRVFVLNSLSTGPEIKLIIEKIIELAATGDDFDSVAEKITAYSKTTGLIFMLQSMNNLANNGRVSKLTAKAAGLLGIRVVGKASDEGTLEILDKCRGEKKGLGAIVGYMREYGFNKGRVRIAHCNNLSAAEELAEKLYEINEDARIEIYDCGGLCSFYAESGGLLVGFEKK